MVLVRMPCSLPRWTRSAWLLSRFLVSAHSLPCGVDLPHSVGGSASRLHISRPTRAFTGQTHVRPCSACVLANEPSFVPVLLCFDSRLSANACLRSSYPTLVTRIRAGLSPAGPSRDRRASPVSTARPVAPELLCKLMPNMWSAHAACIAVRVPLVPPLGPVMRGDRAKVQRVKDPP